MIQMKKTRKLLAVFLVFVLMFPAAAAIAEEEPETWTCPACGLEGNTLNFCPGCGEKKPEAPEAEAGEPEETAAPAAQERRTVIFGHYPQYGDADPIEWIVLEEEDGKAMLISRYLLDMRVFHPYGNRMTWETSALREWLNHDFLNAAFSAEEQAAILLTDVDNSEAQANPDYSNVKSGNDTQDYIYLLSYHEAVDLYFTADEDRVCSITDYALIRGAYAYGDAGAGWWWLRTPGRYSDEAMVTGREGDVRSAEEDRVAGCIRPVLWVNTESEIFQAEQDSPPAGRPEETAITEELLAGTWFGFDMDSEAMSSPNSDFRILRFDPSNRHLDMIESHGYYPELYSGNYRVQDGVLEFIEAGGYSQDLPVRFADGKLILDWYGGIVLSRIDDSEFPEDMEASPYLGENKLMWISAAEDLTVRVTAVKDMITGTVFTVPETVFGQPVTVIDEWAFDSTDTLKNILMPDTVTTICEYAFRYNGFEAIRLPAGLKIIQDNAFEYCANLKQIVIPQGTEHIGYEAFAYCDGLETVVLPDSLTYIDEDAFFGEYLETATFVVRRGSYAEDWCFEHGLRIRALDETEWEPAVEEIENAAGTAAPKAVEDSDGDGDSVERYEFGDFVLIVVNDGSN